MEKFIMSYSGGKDSTLALYRMIKKGYIAESVFTTLNKKYERSLFHGISVEMLNMSASSMGIPFKPIYLDESNYDTVFQDNLIKAKENGASICVFGDIDVIEHRKWGEEKCLNAGMKGVWPLWNESRLSIVHDFIEKGFKAKIKIVNTHHLGAKFLGRDLDYELVEELNDMDVDPCGEGGEFHTFVYDGPIFKNEVRFKIGETVYRDNYAMLDFVAIN